jgi:hypothetical protein
LSIFSEAQGRSQRSLQEVEIYSRLYYADRVAPAAADRIKGLDAASRIKVIREVTKEMYDEEEDEIKAAVVAKMISSREAAANSHSGDEPPLRTPQQYHE